MKLLREPILHFLVLGAVLFGVYALVSGTFTPDESKRIELGATDVDFLAAGFERQWGRPPTPEELQRMIDARVREEVLYREALALGLDRNDGIVRRRMVQKMEMLTEDLALLADPTDEELRSFLSEHQDDYRVPPQLSFSHVYFNVDRRGISAESDAQAVLAQLRSADPVPLRAAERGDSIMLEYDYELQTPDQVRRVFGDRFAEALFELEPGWQGPIPSGYGLHLVHVRQRVEGRVADYDRIRDRLIADYNRVRRERANDALYEKLSEQYQVAIEGEGGG